MKPETFKNVYIANTVENANVFLEDMNADKITFYVEYYREGEGHLNSNCAIVAVPRGHTEGQEIILAVESFATQGTPNYQSALNFKPTFTNDYTSFWWEGGTVSMTDEYPTTISGPKPYLIIEANMTATIRWNGRNWSVKDVSQMRDVGSFAVGVRIASNPV